MKKIFSKAQLGNLNFKNRIFMAPLTRNRAHDNTDVPNDLAKKYYSQRSTAGLIVTEATQISKFRKGHIRTPGIYNDAQARKWKEITQSVHHNDGKIFLQLWHVGRISHSSVLPNQEQPVAPSAIKAKAETFVGGEMKPVSEPRALLTAEIKKIVAEFTNAARDAQIAEFDGVEIHGANGYLIDQFLSDKTNTRDDEYGGTTVNRCRFLREVSDAVIKVWGADRVGIRLSPTGNFNDIGISNPHETFGHVVDYLNQVKLRYIHVVEKFSEFDRTNESIHLLNKLRKKRKGFYIVNGDYDLLNAQNAVESGYADAVAFGRSFISNPDLPLRLERGAGLTEPDKETFYGGDAEGYTDYPFLDDYKVNLKNVGN